jgi:hypothetical protein
MGQRRVAPWDYNGEMVRPTLLPIALCLACFAHAGAQPLAIFVKFTGKFSWVKLHPLPAPFLKSLAQAKYMEFEFSFPSDVKLKKDKKGNTWFTFIVADQGGDWKWHQTSGAGLIPVRNDIVKAGTYKVDVPIAGIPTAIVKGKNQTLSIGLACSGLVKPADFQILSLHGR